MDGMYAPWFQKNGLDVDGIEAVALRFQYECSLPNACTPRLVP